MKGRFEYFLFFIAAIVAGIALNVVEASAKSIGPVGVVVVEATQIYQEPNLDARVIAVVKRGVKLPVSRGTRGDFAKFYRTRVKGKYGWVLILDVKSEAEAKKLFTIMRAAAYKRGPFGEEQPPEDGADGKPREEREPFAFTRNVSLAFGTTEYKESINGVDRATNMTTYGLKLTGPDVFLTGPLMDVNIIMHYGAPDYYTGLSSTKPTGFIMWIDTNLLLPVFMRENILVGIGAGPLLVLSNIGASQNDQVYSMWRLNMGATLELTAGFRIGGVSLRVEGKYLFEKTVYRQAQIALGTEF